MLSNLQASTTNLQVPQDIYKYVDYAGNKLEKILIASQTHWYDSKWFIAIIGSLSGILIVTLISEIKNYTQTKKLKKLMANNFFREVYIIENMCTKNMVNEEKLFESFKEMARNDSFLTHPSVYAIASINTDFYITYLKDIGMFNQQLQREISMFYVLARNLVATTLVLEQRFIKFYAGDKTVGKDDIIDMWGRLLGLGKTIQINAAIIKALLINKYRVDEAKYTPDLKVKKKEIKSFIKNLNSGEKIQIQVLSTKFNVDLLFATTIFLKNKKFIDKGRGEFEKK